MGTPASRTRQAPHASGRWPVRLASEAARGAGDPGTGDGAASGDRPPASVRHAPAPPASQRLSQAGTVHAQVHCGGWAFLFGRGTGAGASLSHDGTVAPRHRSLIAGRGSSPLGELFHACVWVGSCTYQVSVLSGVGVCRPMMVSEVPAWTPNTASLPNCWR
jgi:hypothetical protein